MDAGGRCAGITRVGYDIGEGKAVIGIHSANYEQSNTKGCHVGHALRRYTEFFFVSSESFEQSVWKSLQMPYSVSPLSPAA